MIGRVVRLAAIAGGFALGAYCAARYREQAKRSHKKSFKEQVSNWENEGGNVPSVPTPTPAPGYIPGTQ
jgi:hypothetical protein